MLCLNREPKRDCSGEAARAMRASPFVRYNREICRNELDSFGLPWPEVESNPGEAAEVRNVSASTEEASEKIPLERWMERYQAADPHAPAVLVNAISPALARFFCAQGGSREEADDLLQ